MCAAGKNNIMSTELIKKEKTAMENNPNFSLYHKMWHKSRWARNN